MELQPRSECQIHAKLCACIIQTDIREKSSRGKVPCNIIEKYIKK